MRFRLASSFAVMSLLIVAWGGAAWAQPTRTVTGVVSNSDGGAGVAGATVSVKDAAAATAQSAADGKVTVTKVPVTAVVLEVRAEGYAPVDVQIAAGRTPAVFAATLVKVAPPAPPPTRSITGLVRDSVTGKVLANATVKIQGTEISAQSDADGYFALSGVALSDVVIEVSAVDFGTAAVTVPATDGTAKVALTSTIPAVEAPTTRALRGKLTDESNEPVIGAVIKVVGTDKTALTDENGAFQVDGLPLAEVIIEAEADGYEVQRIIALPTVAEVVGVLKFSAASEQIFIEGRAPAILKSNAGSSAAVVKSTDLTRVTAQTIEGSLSGKVAGANIQSNSGAPGGGAQIRLRGISTINGQSSPLYVIDGVIISNRSVPSGINAITAAAAGGNASVQDNPTNRVADLNPNDIESVEILKGASAAALYGSKASNGVVIITTKRGKGGAAKAKVNLTQRFGFASASNTLGSRQFTSRAEVAEAFSEALANNYTGATYDHEAELHQTKLASETVASISGGNDNSNYFGSLLVRTEPGVIKNTFYDKQSGRVGIGYNIGERGRINFSANVIHSKSDRGLTNNDNTGTSYYVALASTPSFLNLKPNSAGVYPDNPFTSSNPLQTVNRLKNEEEIWRGITSMDIGYKAYADKEHLVTVQSTFGADYYQQHNDVFSPPDLQFERGQTNGRSIESSTENLSANVNLSTTWRFTPKSNAFQSALQIGTTYEYVDAGSVTLVGNTLTSGQEGVDAAVNITAQEALLRTKDQGVYLQEELGLLDNQLTLLGGVLAERSSLNGDVDKLFVFPKFAATYAVPGMPEQIESMRVRGAYGETGNRPNFAWKFTQLNTVAIAGNSAVQVQGTVGDPSTEPERQREFELGTDVVMKDQRAVLELSVYQRNISNVLLTRTLPASTGFNFENLSGGEFRNRGIEASIQVTPITQPDLEWVSRASFTLNRSKVLDVPNGTPFNVPGAGFGTGLGAFRIEEGKSATQIVGPDFDGDGKLNVVGDGEPDFRIGWSNNVTYKNFGLSALVDWQQGSEIINLTRLLYDSGQVSEDYVGAGEARLAAFGMGNPTPYIEDASFIKLREVQLSYNLPKDLISGFAGMETLQVSLSGRNLLTISDYSGLDPEVSNFGSQPVGRNYDVAPYPPSRSFWLSVDAGF